MLTPSAIYKGDSIIVTGSPTQEVLQAFRDFGLELFRRAEVEGYDRLGLLCPLSLTPLFSFIRFAGMAAFDLSKVIAVQTKFSLLLWEKYRSLMRGLRLCGPSAWAIMLREWKTSLKVF